MITVKVKRFINYSEQLISSVRIEAGSNVMNLIETIGLPLDEIGSLSINSSQAMLDQQIEDGDSVEIIPPIGGG